MLTESALMRWTESGWTAVAMLIVAAAVLGLAIVGVRKLIALIMTLRATAMTPRMSRVLSRFLRSTSYSPEEFLRADGAEEQWAGVRKQAIDRLSGFFRARFANSIAWG